MPPPNIGMLFTPPPKDGAGLKAGITDAVKTLFGFYRRHARLMGADLFCRVAGSALQLIVPLVALRVFQVYLPAGDLVSTGWAALVFALLAASSSAFEWGGTISGQWLGFRISGGQAQRIAIARVFLKNPPVLILDEATSALDTFAEAAVQEALKRLSSGRTTIVIAHRLTTIRHATQICYLENGKIVESGTHDELLAQDGRYRALLKTSAR